MDRRNIYLIGFMGVGKSAIAKKLSRILYMEHIEMDEIIAKNESMSISDIFEKFGEGYFRNLESNLLVKLEKKKNCVVSCGGGVVLRSENAEYMKGNGYVVFLKANAQTIYDRVKDSLDRPILSRNMNIDYIKNIMENRLEKYEAYADIVVETDLKILNDICNEIVLNISKLDNK